MTSKNIEEEALFFVKMHGLGNDFIIINLADVKHGKDLSELAINVSRRRLSIGCDQVIFYQPIGANHYQMLIYNQDGSVAKICGNAMRCLTKLLHRLHEIQDIKITVNGNVSDCHVISEDKISVNIGRVSFHAPWMPDNHSLFHLLQNYDIAPQDIVCADIGNPHLIIFKELNDRDKTVVAHIIQDSNLFIDGININFAHIHNNDIYLKVWERGVRDFTLACGSGACASFATALKLGFVKDMCNVIFDEGSLYIHRDDDNNIIMTGPASYVAHGGLYL
ncbi:MAG: diaminopimelate epimerase [Rickettsiaceae bacterium]